jgi:hypothetical protein
MAAGSLNEISSANIDGAPKLAASLSTHLTGQRLPNERQFLNLRWRGARLSWGAKLLGGMSPEHFASPSLLIARFIKDRVAHPLVNRGLPPAGAPRADLDVLRESTVLHLAVHRRSAEAGAFEHGPEAKDAVGGLGHGLILSAVIRVTATRIGN